MKFNHCSVLDNTMATSSFVNQDPSHSENHRLAFDTCNNRLKFTVQEMRTDFFDIGCLNCQAAKDRSVARCLGKKYQTSSFTSSDYSLQTYNSQFGVIRYQESSPLGVMSSLSSDIQQETMPCFYKPTTTCSVSKTKCQPETRNYNIISLENIEFTEHCNIGTFEADSKVITTGTNNTTRTITSGGNVKIPTANSNFRISGKSTAADKIIKTKAAILYKDMTFTYMSSSSLIYMFILIVLLHAPSASHGEPIKVSIHAIIPRHFAMTTELTREFSSTVLNFKRDTRNSRLRAFFSTEEDITFISDDTPREILDAFCKGVLAKRAVTILNINNPLGMRRRTSPNKYILEIANFLGIPVISWDTQFSGSSHTASTDRMLQLAPTIEHQAMAMMSLLERYNWTSFTVVTSQVAGDIQFVAAMESLVDQSNDKIKLSKEETKKERVTAAQTLESPTLESMQSYLRSADNLERKERMTRGTQMNFKILSTIHIRDLTDVSSMLKRAGSDTRVFLLHCSSRASYDIIEAAVKLGLTGKDYIWILTRSSIPPGQLGTGSFPVGLMGISFEYDLEAMKRVVRAGVKMWLYALLDMSQRPVEFANKTIPPQFTCNSDINPYWTDGDIIYRHMLNVNIQNEPQIKFTENGTLKQTEVLIVNLQWHDGQRDKTEWKEVGRWKRYGLQMEDITWPGESSVPPTGKPKRAFLRVATLNELPYVIYRLPNEEGMCEENALPCQVYQRKENKEIMSITSWALLVKDLRQEVAKEERSSCRIIKSNVTVPRCCVGFSMDLLKILSNQLNFDFEIKEVEDGQWGGVNKVTKEWNGLVKVLLENKADIVMTSLKINPERAEAVRFSLPYLETGIKIIVAIRDGAISPTAFLEPYDYASWSLILLFSVHATGSSILIFEWLSPYGLNQGHTSMREHRFSLFRSFWLIWAMLFSTSVQTDSPKGIASRFLANIWALFALVFLASYTANLAAFMITKEVYYDLSGIQDYRLQNPHTMKPPFKYATIPNGSTEANIRANHKDMFNYMKPYNLPDVDAGIAALKQGKIQAFIYDSSVLEYYASRDPQCRLVTVGNRYAMTGYGVGFQPDFQNPWIDKFNKVILRLQETGELDRLQKFWLAGACNMNKEAGVSNRTLGIINFTSAFILLGTGVLLGILILCCEHLYFVFGRKRLRKWDKCGCCSLVSLSMGKSLELKDYVDEAMNEHAKNRCKNPRCETQVWKLKHQLDMALLKIDNLQNQLSSGHGSEALQLALSSVMTHERGPESQKCVALRANGTWSGNTSIIPSNFNGTGNRNTTGASSEALPCVLVDGAKKPRLHETSLKCNLPDIKGNTTSKFSEAFDNSDSSPFPETFPDPLLPPPPLGESPLLGDESRGGSYDLAALGENSYGGDTYMGFDDLSSNDGSAFSGSAGAGQDNATCASPAHMLRRTPSYTSAIGGNMNINLKDNISPARTGRVRQFEGKRYMGVDSNSSPT